jgi:hypothetical protein
MIISTAMILAFAAACLTTITTAPAAPAEMARQRVVVKYHPIVKTRARPRSASDDRI